MRRFAPLVFVLLALAVGAAADGAQARSAPATVKPAAATWTAGRTYTVRVTVQRRGRYSLWLSTDRRRSARDRWLRTVQLPTRRGRRTSTVRVRAPRVKAGRWWLLSCPRASRRCAAARVRLKAAPAVPPAGTTPAPPAPALPTTPPPSEDLTPLPPADPGPPPPPPPEPPAPPQAGRWSIRTCVGASPALPTQPDRFTAFFAQLDHGWVGGDGTWSVALPDGRTLWLFGDTFVGEMLDPTTRAPGWSAVHNSMVVQEGPCATTLLEGTPQEPEALLSVDPGDDRWLWPAAPTLVGGQLRVFYTHVRRTGPGVWDFAVIGTQLATFSLPDLRVTGVRAVSAPAGVHYGAALADSGDWTYIYGVGGGAWNHDLHVARVPRGQLDAPWSFRTADGWSDDPADSVTLLSAVANQLTVLPSPSGGWTLVTQDALLGRQVTAYHATDPAGPWAGAAVVATVPDPGPAAYTYNALVHPQFADPADPGARLLSYNVNGDAAWTDGLLYRPRFLTVRLSDP